MSTERELEGLEENSRKYGHYQVSQYPDYSKSQTEPDDSGKQRSSKKKKRNTLAAAVFRAALCGCIFGIVAALLFLLTVKLGIIQFSVFTGDLGKQQEAVSDLSETVIPETAVSEEAAVEDAQVFSGQDTVITDGSAERKQQMLSGFGATSAGDFAGEDEQEFSGLDASVSETVKKYGIVAGVAEAVMPSIVAITSVSIQEIPSYFGFGFGYGYREYPSTGSGSGIIVGENEEELLIATNNHVVEGASTLSVCFIGNNVEDAEKETTYAASGYGDINLENAITAKIKGTDAENDLAVVAVKKADIPQETYVQIRIARLNASEDLVVGEQVAAIGNALGYGQSLTVGYISALERSITTSDGNTTSGLIQTDAPINPGNSGGALLNMRGEVIGINSAKYASSKVEGVGYAIPISKALPILEELMNRKTRELVEDEEKAAFLGVALADISSEARQMYNVPVGAFIARVYTGGPAYNAGLEEGDVVERVDGQKVSGKDDLLEKLRYYAAGETVEFQIARSENGDYQEKTLNVLLGSKKDYGYTQ